MSEDGQAQLISRSPLIAGCSQTDNVAPCPRVAQRDGTHSSCGVSTSVLAFLLAEGRGSPDPCQTQAGAGNEAGEPCQAHLGAQPVGGTDGLCSGWLRAKG